MTAPLRKDGQPKRSLREKSHCIKGHEFTQANTIERVVKKHNWRFRECRTCRATWNKTACAPPALVAEAIDKIKHGATITQLTRYRPGIRPLIRYNQLVPALRADPDLDRAMRELSKRNAIRVRVSTTAPRRPVLHSNLRMPTLTGVIAAQPDTLFSAIDAAVSRRLHRFIRDDVMGELAELVLSEELALDGLPAAARRLTSRHYSAIKFGPLSLDAPAFRDGTVPLVETISQGIWQ